MRCIYIFGSTTRGEIDRYSDVDLLLISDENMQNIDPNKYSIYTPNRIKEMYAEGNPFAWHLYHESKLIYSSGIDFLRNLGKPSCYTNCKTDLLKFKKLFEDSLLSIREDEFSTIFDLSMIFLAVRNFATCYSLKYHSYPIFSRESFEKLPDYPLKLNYQVKEMLMMSRISSTRGVDYFPEKDVFSLFESEVENIKRWFDQIIKNHESRV